MWYAAHAVMLMELTAGSQDEFHVWENILLVEGATPELAKQKAVERARQDEGGGDFTIGGEPAQFKFLGLRKLISCSSDDDETTGDAKPGNGTEVSFNKLWFSSREDLDLFVVGKEASVVFQDENPPD